MNAKIIDGIMVRYETPEETAQFDHFRVYRKLRNVWKSMRVEGADSTAIAIVEHLMTRVKPSRIKRNHGWKS